MVLPVEVACSKLIDLVKSPPPRTPASPPSLSTYDFGSAVYRATWLPSQFLHLQKWARRCSIEVEPAICGQHVNEAMDSGQDPIAETTLNPQQAADVPLPPSTASSQAALADGQEDAAETYSRPIHGCGCHSSIHEHLDNIGEFEKDINDSLLKLPPVDTPYNSVRVLMVYWKLSDVAHLAVNAERLKKVFEEGYGYIVENHVLDNGDDNKDDSIIYQDFNSQLVATIRAVSKRDENNLLILYYVGHGAPVVEDGSLVTYVWQPTREKPNRRLEWKEFQFTLRKVHCDVLFLFDCCHALAMIDDKKQWTRRSEIFCASSALEKASALKSSSFTNAITEELLKRKDARGNAVGWYYTLLTGSKESLEYKLIQAPLFRQYSGPAYRTGIFLQSKKFSPELATAPAVVYYSDSASDSAISMASSDRAQLFRDLSNLTDARVLIKIRLRSPAEKLLKEDWLNMFEHRPANVDRIQLVIVDKVRCVGLFEADSSILLVTMPVSLWQNMKRNPAYVDLGIVRSENLLSSHSAAESAKAQENVEAAVKLAQWEQKLADRERELELMNREREQKLADTEKEQRLAERDREQRLAAREQELIDRERIALEKENQALEALASSERQEKLAAREREQRLADKERGVLEKERRVLEQERKVSRGSQEVLKREIAVAEREEQIQRREAALTTTKTQKRTPEKFLTASDHQSTRDQPQPSSGVPDFWFHRGPRTYNLSDGRTAHLLASRTRMVMDRQILKAFG